jgi:hypothetical protein
MEKAFRNFIQSTITDFLAPSGWKVVKPPKGSLATGKGPLWKKVGTNGASAFILGCIHDKSSSVTLYIGWNATAEFPPIEPAMEAGGEQPVLASGPGQALAEATALLEGREQGWFDQQALGHPWRFELATAIPPLDRLASVFDDPKNERKVRVGLLEPHYTHWREATPFHYWGMVAYFDTLTEDDARIAVGGTCDQVIGMLKTQVLPLTARHLGEA